MSVTEGTGAGQWPVVIQQVSNGEPASETVLRRPSIDLENRTLAHRTSTDAQETLRDLQLGTSPSSIGGVQGTFNTVHKHDGIDSALLDLQVAYDNGVDGAIIKLGAGGSLDIRDSSNASIWKLIESTGKIEGNNNVGAAEIDFGTGPDQVNMDNMVDGSTNAAITLAQETSFVSHLTANNQHGHKFLGFPLQLANISVTGNSAVVTSEMSAESPGGADGVEGIVTDAPDNYVILSDTSSDEITDSNGNKVFARITEAAAVWTLQFFSNVAGVETSFSGFSSTTILWYVQKIFAPSNRPIFAPIFSLRIDQKAATGIIDLSAVAQNIIPDGDGTRDLGSASKKWKDLFLTGATLFMGSEGQIKYNESAKRIQFKHETAGSFISVGNNVITQIQNFTTIGNVGDVGQQFAGHAFATDEGGVGTDIALYLFGGGGGAIIDDEEGAFNLTNIGSTPESGGIFGGSSGAAELNGSTHAFSQPTLLDTVPAALAIDVWFNASDGRPSSLGRLVDKENVPANDRIFIEHQTNGVMRVFFEQNNAGNLILQTNNVFADGVETGWHYLVFTWDTINGARLYMDSVLQSSLPSETTLMANLSGGTDLFIGSNSSGTERFSGKIGTVRLRNQILTQADIDFGFATEYVLSFSDNNYEILPRYRVGGSTSFERKFNWDGVEISRSPTSLRRAGFTEGFGLASTDTLLINAKE